LFNAVAALASVVNWLEKQLSVYHDLEFPR
jgi:hypothetical protein